MSDYEESPGLPKPFQYPPKPSRWSQTSEEDWRRFVDRRHKENEALLAQALDPAWQAEQLAACHAWLEAE